MAAILAIIGGLALLFGVIIYSSFSWGFVCMKFWMWFIIPIFPELPVLSFIQCVGLMFFIGLFNINHSDTKKSDDSTATMVTALILPWLTLALAWMVKILFIS